MNDGVSILIGVTYFIIASCMKESHYMFVVLGGNDELGKESVSCFDLHPFISSYVRHNLNGEHIISLITIVFLLSVVHYRKTALTMLTFLGDPNSELTKALDLELTDPGPVSKLGPGRCKRFAMHVVNGEIKAVNVSEGPDDPAGDNDPSASLADGIMATMK